MEEPLFPGYLFLLGTLDQAYTADRTRIANIIRVHDQRLDWELQNLQVGPRVARRGARSLPVPAEPACGFDRDRCRGFQGVVDERINDRLILQVETLGQAVSLRSTLLEPSTDTSLRVAGMMALSRHASRPETDDAAGVTKVWAGTTAERREGLHAAAMAPHLLLTFFGR